jgi:hypothetical protein
MEAAQPEIANYLVITLRETGNYTRNLFCFPENEET